MDEPKMTEMLGFCSSPTFIRHLTGPGHPERPDRIRAIHAAVRQAGLVRSPNPFPDFHADYQIAPLPGEPCAEIAPSPADERWLETIHPRAYIDRVKKICAEGGLLDQSDTPVCPDSWDCALLSCGAVLTCCDAVVGGTVRRAYAAIRPPGHHAEPRQPMGFCVFANVAIAARYLQQHHGVGKIAIVDFDVHHGNGTQAAFESDASVLFISLHQHPRTSYPGTGFDWETGVGPGRGFTLNIPLPPGTKDAEYLAVLDQQAIPKLDDFRPEIMLISAGFDAHKDDPLAELKLTEDGFFQITKRLTAVADRHCGGKIISAQEGGYNLRALGRSVVAHLAALR
jgi:acetoin utilization deacetylase AcuC-like enzyme